MLRAARALGESETVRVDADPARAPRLAAGIRGAARGVRRARHRRDAPGRGASRGWRRRSTPFARGSASRRDEVARLVRGGGGARPEGQAPCRAALATCTAPRSPPSYGALSADHLEHARRGRRRGDGARGDGRGAAARRLLRAEGDAASRRSTCCAATACRWRWRPTAIPAPRRSLSPTLMLSMACTLFGLTPEEALAGMTREGARALGLQDEIGTITRRQGRGPVRLAGRAGRPSFATGSACRGRSGGSSAGRMPDVIPRAEPVEAQLRRSDSPSTLRTSG